MHAAKLHDYKYIKLFKICMTIKIIDIDTTTG